MPIANENGGVQGDLFGRGGERAGIALPAGWRYQTGFISEAEEAGLLQAIAATSLEEARYKAYTAKRRVANFGTAYDFDTNHLLAGPPMPDWLNDLKARAAAWADVPGADFSSALIAEYRPGTTLGWHRDVPDFEVVFGVSLGSDCRMRLRRYPPVEPKKADVVSVELEARSAYLLRGAARWNWQHSIAPTPALRWSITLRTRARRRAAGRGE